MRSKPRIFAATALFPLLGLLLSAPLSLVWGSESWHVTPGAGVLLVPGGQPARDGLVETLRLGYDLDAPVSIELGGLVGNLDNRDDAADGRRSAIGGTWADAIIHLARWERLDPYLNAGTGAFWSDHHTLPGGHQEGVTPRLGAGILYTLSEHWSAHIGATVMTTRLPDRHACFGILEAGLSYYFGDTTPAQP
jgi:hypothetical protein